MIKITTKISGKVYMLVPQIKPKSCEGCYFREVGTTTCRMFAKDCSFNDKVVCGRTLCGIWEEIKDEKQYEYGVESFFNGHWIIEQTGFDELCEAEDYIDVHKQNHPEDKLRTVRREIGKWEVVKNEKAN